MLLISVVLTIYLTKGICSSFLQNEHRLLWKLGTLPAGLVTFWNQTFPLDHKWHLLGLGYKPNVNQKDIEGAAVIHYNGNRKPWLEIAMAKYRKYWSKYVNFDNVFIRQCNIHPWVADGYTCEYAAEIIFFLGLLGLFLPWYLNDLGGLYLLINFFLVTIMQTSYKVNCKFTTILNRYCKLATIKVQKYHKNCQSKGIVAKY